MYYKKCFTVSQPPGAVIDFIGDFNNLPQWDESIRQVRQTAGEGIGVGSEYHVAVGFASKTILMRYRTVAYEPGREIVLEGEAASARALDRIHVESIPAGTRVTYTTDIRALGWAGRMLDPFMQFLFGFNVRRAVANLKRLLS